MNSYIRIKDKKRTYFLQSQPTDTVRAIKLRLQKAFQEPHDIRDYKLFLNKGKEFVALEDTITLESLGIQEDDCIYLAFGDGKIPSLFAR